MSTFEQDPEREEDECYVPTGVLAGLDDLEEGRTLSDDDLEDVLKF